MKRLNKLFYFIFFPLTIALCHSAFAQQDYTQFVNPFIGTGGHGHTFPGATVPFGMVQLSPDTRIDGSWDGCSGYHFSDNKIYGFSHTHLSGTGCSDYGDVMLMPQTSMPKSINPMMYGTTFKHANEKAEAGYYSVKLDNEINCEFTTTTRSGFHKYTFSGGKKGYLIIDLKHRDKLLEGNFNLIDGKKIEGYRVSEAWAKKQYVYFVMEFSEPIKLNSPDKNQPTQGVIIFTPKKKTPLLVKVGISQTSIEGARKNLDSEIPHWDFEKTKEEAKALWNKELSKIEISNGYEPSKSSLQTEKIDELTVFYTALYHCMIHPSVASDVDGKYRGMDLKIHDAKDFTYYTVFSLWDTFRALHPLFTIIDQKRTNDFIKTFLAMYEQGGRLPVWELSSNETDCMIGYHSVSVITDAYTKGIKNFDTELALKAMQESANNSGYRSIGIYTEKGFLSSEDESESVSKTLEYSYDDWCISQYVKISGNDTDIDYSDRGLAWRNLFDSKSQFIRPRFNGGWLSPFEPREVNNNYTEANAWQYTFFVPQDINGMISQMGGPKYFEKKLDELFSTSSQTTGRNQADITGLIGQYAHGNEPSHHMAYLYTYAGVPHKSQKILHQIKTEFYKNDPDGLIGNEDCGQMSAWYVFSSLGFYPVCPGDGKYVVGAPSFEKAIIHLENGNDFTIIGENVKEDHFYLSGNTQFAINHKQMMEGGSLSFQMSDKPETELMDEPYSLPENYIISTFISAPIIHSNGKTFKDSILIEIEGNLIIGDIFYSFQPDWGILDSNNRIVSKYTKPFYIKNSSDLYVWTFDHELLRQSPLVSSSFHKIENDYTIEISGKYNPQYTAGGDNGIIDGLHGDVDWRKGGWQGYQSQDFECVIDLKEVKQIQKIDATFLQDTRAWIFFPKQVEIYTSYDGKEYRPFGTQPITTFKSPSDNVDASIEKASSFTKPINCQFVKIIARNYGKLPAWHQGYGMEGDNAFIFIDEITIK